jgi:hypothetical protein
MNSVHQRKNLADIIDLLAANADELTIRLLLGERAERAFYAIVQQGTDALREHARELRQHGENATYARAEISGTCPDSSPEISRSNSYDKEFYDAHG